MTPNPGCETLANNSRVAYLAGMAATLSISLSDYQLAWIKSRKAEGGYTSASDVLRDLIRREQEKEWGQIEARFNELSKDGAPGEPPIQEIVSTVRKVKRELKRKREAGRRS